MIKNKNPFIVSGKIPTELFCDRKEEAACLLKFLQSEENVVLMSQRRMGKTKLVEYCSDVDSQALLLGSSQTTPQQRNGRHNARSYLPN